MFRLMICKKSSQFITVPIVQVLSHACCPYKMIEVNLN